jgi:hypothetical protein
MSEEFLTSKEQPRLSYLPVPRKEKGMMAMTMDEEEDHKKEERRNSFKSVDLNT